MARLDLSKKITGSDVRIALSTEVEVETEKPIKRQAFRATYHGPEKSTEGLIRVREILVVAPHFERAHRKAQKNAPEGAELVKLEKLPDVIL